LSWFHCVCYLIAFQFVLLAQGGSRSFWLQQQGHLLRATVALSPLVRIGPAIAGAVIVHHTNTPSPPPCDSLLLHSSSQPPGFPFSRASSSMSLSSSSSGPACCARGPPKASTAAAGPPPCASPFLARLPAPGLGAFPLPLTPAWWFFHRPPYLPGSAAQWAGVGGVCPCQQIWGSEAPLARVWCTCRTARSARHPCSCQSPCSRSSHCCCRNGRQCASSFVLISLIAPPHPIRAVACLFFLPSSLPSHVGALPVHLHLSTWSPLHAYPLAQPCPCSPQHTAPPSHPNPSTCARRPIGPSLPPAPLTTSTGAVVRCTSAPQPLPKTKEHTRAPPNASSPLAPTGNAGSRRGPRPPCRPSAAPSMPRTPCATCLTRPPGTCDCSKHKDSVASAWVPIS